MSFSKTYFYSLVPLFSDITAIYCLFSLLAAQLDSASPPFSFLIYFLGACLAALVNNGLARQDRPLLAVVAINAVIAVCLQVAMFKAPHHFTALDMTVLAAFLFLYPVLRSFYLSRNPISINAMLLYCEWSVLGVGLFLLIQQTSSPLNSLVNPLCLIALLLNLLSLSTLRIAGAQKNISSRVSLRRLIFLTAFITVLLIAATAISFFSPAFKSVVLYILTRAFDLLTTSLWLIWSFILFLLSLLPEVMPFAWKGDGKSLANWDVSPDVAAEQARANIPAAVPYVLLAAVVLILLFLLYRYRKYRIRAVIQTGAVQKEKSNSPSLFQVLIMAFKKLYKKIQFYKLLFTQLNTYAGVFVRLENRGKRLGLPRRPDQTPREFLTTLYNHADEQNEFLLSSFLTLAEFIDRQCFQADHSPANRKMNPEQLKAVLLSVSPQKRLKKILSSKIRLLHSQSLGKS